MSLDLIASYQKQCSYVECGRHIPGGFFSRNHIVTVDKINEYRFRHNNTGIYATIYHYDNSTQKDANLWGSFYLDLDKKATMDENSDYLVVKNDALLSIRYLTNVAGIPHEQINIYFSGKKGLHITVNPIVFMIEPCKNLNVIYRALAEDIKTMLKCDTIDMNIYDTKRLFRLPLSIHQDTNLYKIPISHDELKNLTLPEIKELAKEPRNLPKVTPYPVGQTQLLIKAIQAKITATAKPLKNIKYDTALKVTPPCIQSILEEPIGEGQRNNTSIALASFFRQRGYNIETAQEMLITWSHEKCSPELNEKELDCILNQAYAKGYRYGCNKLRLLGTCHAKKCDLNGQHRQVRA